MNRVFMACSIIFMAHHCSCCRRTPPKPVPPPPQTEKPTTIKPNGVTVTHWRVKVDEGGLLQVLFEFNGQLVGTTKKYSFEIVQLKDNICQQNDTVLDTITRSFQTGWTKITTLMNCAKYAAKVDLSDVTFTGKSSSETFEYKLVEDPVINGSFLTHNLLYLSWNATQNMCENSAIIAEVSDAANRSSCVTVVVGNKQCIIPQSINCSHIRYENAKNVLSQGHLMIYPNLTPRPSKYVVSVWKLDYELKLLIKGFVLDSYPAEGGIWWIICTVSALAVFTTLIFVLIALGIAAKSSNCSVIVNVTPSVPKRIKPSKLRSAVSRMRSKFNSSSQYDHIADLQHAVRKHFQWDKRMTENKQSVADETGDNCIEMSHLGTPSGGKNVKNLKLVDRQPLKRTKRLAENKESLDTYLAMTYDGTQSSGEYIGFKVTGPGCKQSGIVLPTPDICSVKLPTVTDLVKKFDMLNQ